MRISLSCCGVSLDLSTNQIEDETSWQARCPICGKHYWLEVIGQEDVDVIHLVPENGKWVMKTKEAVYETE
jgi:hypothetical protein